ncbi:TRAP transporter small permease [Cereibacter azotoformans]|uniref:TRAP transporter small permease protein n=2 Tax=Cereibacter TaxID=1653176 RepID=A0A2T5KD53_9RHOB|nr:TRAP transporter small permease [Cereibacter azotoformans]AXQ93572.1 TRAP transporter small permease [Cereibacter sphaeroides]MBO4168660.1 TRAP transporter small permease [Cereibacter azotoformans]PTR20350.1 TRAP-type C4-dicarboxylate transport system permease small subunit [Cereibacter azotoformans]UIJ31910.1 TRAP transporter small permease [Cereibacter azotoformans]ULB09740.1 TRAP transporter small permease [Cereibacter azotoformans]
MKGFSKGLSVLEALLSRVILGFYALVVCVVVFQVVNRFWLHLPIIWLSDLAIISFIWLGFLTAALAVRRGGHFRMALMLDLAGEGRMRRGLELFSHLVGLAMFGLLAVTGWQMAVRGLREISPGLQIPMSWAYASVVVAGLLAVLFLLEAIALELAGKARAAGPDPEREE